MYGTYQHLKFDRRGRVLTITMNRPEVKNAANARMHHELSTVFREVARDPDADVIVLTGAGDAFSAGGDIAAMKEKIADRSKWVDTVNEAREIFYGMLELEKPLIARVNGPAVGLGATLAVYCDIVIASDNAVFGDPHVKVGLVAGDGGALMWPLLMGFQRAKEYLLTGDTLTAAEAERFGLVNHVVAAGQLDDRVYAMAEKLAKTPKLAVGWTKKAINHTLKQLALSTFEFGISLETQSQMTRDHEEAVNAFVEKRKPAFTGR
jgi:enoyl-CoA hydratase